MHDDEKNMKNLFRKFPAIIFRLCLNLCPSMGHTDFVTDMDTRTGTTLSSFAKQNHILSLLLSETSPPSAREAAMSQVQHDFFLNTLKVGMKLP